MLFPIQHRRPMRTMILRILDLVDFLVRLERVGCSEHGGDAFARVFAAEYPRSVPNSRHDGSWSGAAVARGVSNLVLFFARRKHGELFVCPGRVRDRLL